LVFIEFLVCSTYSVYVIGTVSPADVGYQLLSRDRIYLVMVHKLKAVLQNDLDSVYAAVSRSLMANTTTRPHDCMIDSHEHVMEEARLRSSYRKLGDPDTPRDAMNTREIKALRRYSLAFHIRFRQLCTQFPWLVFFLGDDGGAYKCWSAVSGTIPTYRHHSGIYWFPWFGRCMTAREKLGSMGFPVFDAHAQVMRVPTMQIMSPLVATKMTGNCMHMANAGVILLTVLACVKLHDTPRLPLFD